MNVISSCYFVEFNLIKKNQSHMKEQQGLGEGMKENLNQSDKFFQESQTSSLTHTAKCAEV